MQLEQHALDLLFLNARSQNGWQDAPLDESVLFLRPRTVMRFKEEESVTPSSAR